MPAPIVAPGNVGFAKTPGVISAPPKVGVSYYELTVVAMTTTPTIVDIQANIDASTIKSITTAGLVIVDFINIHTTDYNWNTYNTSYTYDGTEPVAGSVGPNDNDNGRL